MAQLRILPLSLNKPAVGHGHRRTVSRWHLKAFQIQDDYIWDPSDDSPRRRRVPHAHWNGIQEKSSSIVNELENFDQVNLRVVRKAPTVAAELWLLRLVLNADGPTILPKRPVWNDIAPCTCPTVVSKLFIGSDWWLSSASSWGIWVSGWSNRLPGRWSDWSSWIFSANQYITTSKQLQ